MLFRPWPYAVAEWRQWSKTGNERKGKKRRAAATLEVYLSTCRLVLAVAAAFAEALLRCPPLQPHTHRDGVNVMHVMHAMHVMPVMRMVCMVCSIYLLSVFSIVSLRTS